MVGAMPTEGLTPTFAVKFWGAGAAGCIADLVTYPLDTAKVRLQVRYGWRNCNSIQMWRQINSLL